jgi:mannose-6-phosphate isomerase class I
VAESLASIDFNDFEPGLVSEKFIGSNGLTYRTLVNDPLFAIHEYRAESGAELSIKSGKPRVVAAVNGKLVVRGGSVDVSLSNGEFCLVPAQMNDASVRAEENGIFLVATAN